MNSYGMDHATLMDWDGHPCQSYQYWDIFSCGSRGIPDPHTHVPSLNHTILRDRNQNNGKKKPWTPEKWVAHCRFWRIKHVYKKSGIPYRIHRVLNGLIDFVCIYVFDLLCVSRCFKSHPCCVPFFSGSLWIWYRFDSNFVNQRGDKHKYLLITVCHRRSPFIRLDL